MGFEIINIVQVTLSPLNCFKTNDFRLL